MHTCKCLLFQVAGLDRKLGRPWNDMTQQKINGRLLEAWLFLDIILAAVSCKVRTILMTNK